VVCFHVQSFEGGSPYLSQLRTDRLAPVSKFDYVSAHTGYPTIPLGCTKDSVWATHGYPSRYHVEDMH
jgi:hypothetical protein